MAIIAIQECNICGRRGEENQRDFLIRGRYQVYSDAHGNFINIERSRCSVCEEALFQAAKEAKAVLQAAVARCAMGEAAEEEKA